MFNGNGGYSLADLAAATRDGDGFGNNQWWIIVLFMFAFNNGWGGGFGNNGGAALNSALTRGELCQDMNFQELNNSVRGIQSGLCDGFYAQLSNYAAMQRQLCDEFRDTNNNIQQARFDMQKCCCGIENLVQQAMFQSERQACDIKATVDSRIRDLENLIQSNTIQDLRDKIADKDRALMGAQFEISQVSQTAQIVNEVRPCSKPAYITQSPFVTSGCNGCNGYNGCGNN